MILRDGDGHLAITRAIERLDEEDFGMVRLAQLGRNGPAGLWVAIRQILRGILLLRKIRCRRMQQDVLFANGDADLADDKVPLGGTARAFSWQRLVRSRFQTEAADGTIRKRGGDRKHLPL